MNSYLALIRLDLLMLARNRAVIIFNYIFPLIFFFVFAGIFKIGTPGGRAPAEVLGMVLTLGMLGNGLYGAGMKMVQDREAGILRRYKVAPISPQPLLVASIVSGWAGYLPLVIGLTLLNHFRYHMAWPQRPLTLLLLLLCGLAAFRALGLIIAAAANNTQESNALIQAIYMPCLMLSGAAVPLSVLPAWGATVAKFLPASYLVTGLGTELGQPAPLGGFFLIIGVLLLSTLICLFVAGKLFRWEPDQKISGRAKLWVLAALLPFLALGAWRMIAGG
jgi:ABC-2 type transport system permease protein